MWEREATKLTEEISNAAVLQVLQPPRFFIRNILLIELLYKQKGKKEKKGGSMNHDLLERIYEAYANEIRLYLYSLCGSMPQAEDLMQEVFVKALLSLKDEHTNFRAWLYKVAHNLCINEMKKSGGPGKGLVSEAAWENNGGRGMSAEAALPGSQAAVRYTHGCFFLVLSGRRDDKRHFLKKNEE